MEEPWKKIVSTNTCVEWSFYLDKLFNSIPLIWVKLELSRLSVSHNELIAKGCTRQQWWHGGCGWLILVQGRFVNVIIEIFVKWQWAQHKCTEFAFCKLFIWKARSWVTTRWRRSRVSCQENIMKVRWKRMRKWRKKEAGNEFWKKKKKKKKTWLVGHWVILQPQSLFVINMQNHFSKTFHI